MFSSSSTDDDILLVLGLLDNEDNEDNEDGVEPVIETTGLGYETLLLALLGEDDDKDDIA
jgi:hypothetical protein